MVLRKRSARQRSPLSSSKFLLTVCIHLGCLKSCITELLAENGIRLLGCGIPDILIAW